MVEVFCLDASCYKRRTCTFVEANMILDDSGTPDSSLRPRLLVITYGFPPVGGTGARRISKFVKYLDRAGWDSIVLTPRRVLRNERDPGAAADLPATCHVIRTPTWEPVSRQHPHSRPLMRLRRIVNVPLIPSVVGLWALPALPYFLRAVEAHRPNIILSTGPDFTAHVIASWLATRFQLPLVLDYRDEWTSHPLREDFARHSHRKRELPKRVKFRLDRELEKRVLGGADRILTTTSGMRTHMSDVFQVPLARFEVVTNGFDPDEFPAASSRSGENQRAGRGKTRRIVHLGSFFRESQRVGKLFRALRDKAEYTRETLVYRQVGFISQPLRDWLESFRSTYFVLDFVAPLPAREGIALAATSDLLLAFCRGAGEERYINLKLFEYLACNVPILSLCDRDSESARLFAACGGGFALDLDAGDSVQEWLEKWWHGQSVPPRNHGEIEKLAWPNLGQRLARLLTELSSEKRGDGLK